MRFTACLDAPEAAPEVIMRQKTRMRLIRRIAKRLCHSGDKGVTLIEVLSAMVVLTIGILGLAPMMVLSVTGNEFSTEVTNVVAAAQQSLEQRVGLGGFGAMPYTNTTTYGNGKYTVTTLVRDNSVDPNVPVNLYEFDVTANWVDDSGVSRNLAFTTYSPKP